ncbi:MAG TPA: transposase [Nitrospinota bacterium]|jgi:transposase-like protein|nr:transposase [Nitrospinota bacterium]
MKYRKWDSNTKAKIVLEGLQNKMLLSGLCNRHQITQNTYYNWLKKFETKSHKVFESLKESKKEQRLKDENKNLKRIIAELSIELKKTELELEGEYP